MDARLFVKHACEQVLRIMTLCLKQLHE